MYDKSCVKFNRRFDFLYLCNSDNEMPMDHLPQDVVMLVSSVNMLLRDGEFDSLESLCAYYDQDMEALTENLAAAGYAYNDALRQIRPE